MLISMLSELTDMDKNMRALSAMISAQNKEPEADLEEVIKRYVQNIKKGAEELEELARLYYL